MKRFSSGWCSRAADPEAAQGRMSGWGRPLRARMWIPPDPPLGGRVGGGPLALPPPIGASDQAGHGFVHEGPFAMLRGSGGPPARGSGPPIGCPVMLGRREKKKATWWGSCGLIDVHFDRRPRKISKVPENADRVAAPNEFRLPLRVNLIFIIADCANK